MVQRGRLLFGTVLMSRVYTSARRKFSHLSRSILMAAAVLGTTQVAIAGPTVDQLSDCLVKATTAADKTTVLQWTFTALAAHPDLKGFSSVTPEQKNQIIDNEKKCQYQFDFQKALLIIKSEQEGCERFTGIYRLYD